jgi:hypothetical protein
MESPEEIKLEYVEPLNPDKEAKYDMSRDFFKQSFTRTRDFCKFMITLSTTSIGAYLALLNYIFPKGSLDLFPQFSRFLLFVTPFIYFFSIITFIHGYYPRANSSNKIINVIELIEEDINTMIKRDNMLVLWGTLFFIIGCLFAFVSIMYSLQRGA